MDWSKTKTIFIFTFLILNIFLGYHLMEKRDNSQLDIITETSIEEKFEVDEIVLGDLPKDTTREAYLNGKSRIFDEEDLELLEEKEQIASIVDQDQTLLRSTFPEPIPLPENNVESRLEQMIRSEVINGEHYEYWGLSEESRSLVYFQKYDDNFIYSNIYGMLLLLVNEENEIIGYEQRFIENMEEMDEEQEIIPAIKALENLYNIGELKPGSEVTRMELGYYTLVNITSSHVLTPTWHIVIDDEHDLFVNAFEGQVIRKESRKLE